MSLYVVFVYLEYWFTAPSLFSASSNDLQMWTRILTFKRVHKKVSSCAAAVLRRHTWYLTEDLIALASSSTTAFRRRHETTLHRR